MEKVKSSEERRLTKLKQLLIHQTCLFARINGLFLQLYKLETLIKSMYRDEVCVRKHLSDPSTKDFPVYYKVLDRIVKKKYAWTTDFLPHDTKLHSYKSPSLGRHKFGFPRSYTDSLTSLDYLIPSPDISALAEIKYRNLLKSLINSHSLHNIHNALWNGTQNLCLICNLRVQHSTEEASCTPLLDNSNWRGCITYHRHPPHEKILASLPTFSIHPYRNLDDEAILQARLRAKERQKLLIKKVAQKLPISVVAQYYDHSNLRPSSSYSNLNSKSFLMLQNRLDVKCLPKRNEESLEKKHSNTSSCETFSTPKSYSRDVSQEYRSPKSSQHVSDQPLPQGVEFKSKIVRALKQRFTVKNVTKTEQGLEKSSTKNLKRRGVLEFYQTERLKKSVPSFPCILFSKKFLARFQNETSLLDARSKRSCEIFPRPNTLKRDPQKLLSPPKYQTEPSALNTFTKRPLQLSPLQCTDHPLDHDLSEEFQIKATPQNNIKKAFVKGYSTDTTILEEEETQQPLRIKILSETTEDDSVAFIHSPRSELVYSFGGRIRDTPTSPEIHKSRTKHMSDSSKSTNINGNTKSKDVNESKESKDVNERSNNKVFKEGNESKHVNETSKRKDVNRSRKSKDVNRISESRSVHDGNSNSQIYFSNSTFPDCSLRRLCIDLDKKSSFKAEPLIVQLYIKIIAQYGSPAHAFKTWANCQNASESESLDYMKVSQHICALMNELEPSSDETLNLFLELCQPLPAKLTLASFYRNIEGIESLSPDQILRRLSEIYGNPPVQAFNDLGLCLQDTMNDAMFKVLCSKIGVSADEAVFQWNMIPLYEGVQQNGVSCIRILDFFAGGQSTQDFQDCQVTREYRNSTEQLKRVPSEGHLSLKPYVIRPNPKLISLIERAQKRSLVEHCWKSPSISLMCTTVDESTSTSVSEIWKFLREHTPLSNVSEEASQHILEVLKLESYKEGSIIMQKNQPVENLYIVFKGLVGLIENQNKVKIYRVGESFGLSWLRGQYSCPYIVQAVEPTELILLPYNLCGESKLIDIWNFFSVDEIPENLKPLDSYCKRISISEEPAMESSPENLINSPIVKAPEKREKKIKKKKVEGKKTAKNCANLLKRIKVPSSEKKKLKPIPVDLVAEQPVRKHTIEKDYCPALLDKLNKLNQSIAEFFNNMITDRSPGYVKETLFAKKIVLGAKGLLQGERVLIRKLYIQLSRPFRDKLFLSSLYRNTMGSTSDYNTIGSRLEQIAPYAVCWPWAKFAQYLTHESDAQLNRNIFERTMLLIGLTGKDARLVWESLLPSHCESVQACDLFLFFKGSLPVSALHEKYKATESVLKHIMNIFNYESPSSQNPKTEGGLSDFERPQNDPSSCDLNTILASLEPHITDIYESMSTESMYYEEGFDVEIDLIFETLLHRRPWRCLHETQLKYVIAQMSRVIIQPGHLVWNEDEQPSSMYVVVSGVLMSQPSDSYFSFESSNLVAYPGCILCENILLDLIGTQFVTKDLGEVQEEGFPGTIRWRARAPAECILWSLSLTQFDSAIRPMLMERLKKIPYIYQVLDILAALQKLNDIEKYRLAEESKIEVFSEKSTISAAKRCIIVLAGKATAVTGFFDKSSKTPCDKKLNSNYSPGDIFGGLSVTTKSQPLKKFKAKKNLKVLCISQASFTHIIKASCLKLVMY